MIVQKNVEMLNHDDHVINMGFVKSLIHDLENNRVEVTFNVDKPCKVVNNPFEPRIVMHKGANLLIEM